MKGNKEQCYAFKFFAKLKKTKQEAYGILKEANGDEQTIGDLTNFLKEMNRLRINPDLEHRTVHARRKTLRKCKD